MSKVTSGRRIEGFRLERLDARHDRSTFNCGAESLDAYLKTQASQDQKRNVAVVYLLVAEDTGRIAGYFTLSSASIDPGLLPAAAQKKLPKYGAVPATIIGRLAIDSTFKGRGFGGALLTEALRECAGNSERVGSVAVIVDAIDEGAANFYEKYGFTRFTGGTRRLYLFMTVVRGMMSS